MSDKKESNEIDLMVFLIAARLHASLGECSNDHSYTIKAENGEWWIEHNQVGSAEPLKQWIKSTLSLKK